MKKNYFPQLKNIILALTAFSLLQCKHTVSSESDSALSSVPLTEKGLDEFNLDHWLFFHELGQLSISAYQDPEDIDEFLSGINPALAQYPKVFIEKSNVQAYLTETETHLILAFRGTESNIEDFITDISILPPINNFSEYKDTHPGFLKAYQEIKPELYATLQNAPGFQQRKPLMIVGHSLGGSLATITALDLYKAGYPIANVVTYGAPPAFKKKKAEEYDKYLKDVTYRFVNNYDLIPTLLTKVLRFKHVGHTIFFRGDECSATLKDWFRVKPFNFKDHAMVRYLGCFLQQY